MALTSRLFHHRHDDDDDDDETEPMLFSAPPVMLVDAFYLEGVHWPSCALQKHDVVLMVAGGVGIVPFLNLLREMHHHVRMMEHDQSPLYTVRHVVLHWYCRELGLLRYMLNKYLMPVFASNHQTNTTNQIFVKKDEEEGKLQQQNLTPDKHTQEQNESTIGCRCRFEINVHVTSRSANDNEINLHNLLNKQAETDDTSSPSSSSPPKEQHQDVLITYPTTSSTNTTTAAHIETSTMELQPNWRYNIFPFGVFVTVALPGLLIHMWQYTQFIAVYDTVAFLRLYGLYMVMMLSLVVAIVGEYYTTRPIFGSEGGGGRGKEQFCEASESTIMNTSSSSSASSSSYASSSNYQTFPNNGGNSSPNKSSEQIVSPANAHNNSSVHEKGPYYSSFPMNVEWNITGGRPDPLDVVRCVTSDIKAEKPGAFFCGPMPLLRSIQSTIRKSRSRSSIPCAIYEEPAEM